MRITVLLTASVMLIWPQAGAEAFTRYTATRLPGVTATSGYGRFYGPYYGLALGLNNAGQVSGKAVVPVGEFKMSHAVLWDPVAGLRDLAPGDTRSSHAMDANDRGQVVVNVTQYPGQADDYRAFLWQDGVMTGLGTLGDAHMSYAVRVNEAGQIVGWTYSPGWSAFLWDPLSGMRDLGSLGGGRSYPLDINDHGMVVGYANTPTGGRAFLWQDGVMTDISGGRWYGMAYAVNNRGQVVGTYYDTSAQAAAGFVWDAQSGLRNLGSLGGEYTYPVAINNLGQIVGWEDVGYQREEPFIWEDGVMMNLNDLIEPGVVQRVNEVVAINDRGQILANGVLLTPIPEPSSLAGLCLALGGVGVGWMRRRRMWPN